MESHSVSDEGSVSVQLIQFCFFCHIINNMLKLTDLKNDITSCSELANFFKNAGLCSHLSNSTLKSYSKTRWHSTCEMFESIDANFAKIVEILAEKQSLSRASNVDISIVSELALFLKAFKEISISLEGYKQP